MNEKFKYCTLKYRPSYLLDERVNIGILFYFPNTQKLEFLFPSRLSRLKQLFPKVNLSDIKTYLKSFKNTSNNLSITDLSNEVLSQRFLTPDANSLFFSEIKAGTTNSPQETLDYYYDSFLGNYKANNKPQITKSRTAKYAIPEYISEKTFEPKAEYLIDRHDEKYLNHKFSSILSSSEKFEKNLFLQKISITNKLGKTDFDFGWQNGTTNLVKSISFDYTDKNRIKNQSFRCT